MTTTSRSSQVIETTGNSLWVSPLSFLNASTPGTGGFIDTPNQRLGVHHVSPITSAEDLAQVSLEGPGGTEANAPTGMRLGDVADVVEDHQPLIGDATVGDGRGLLLVIEKFPGANTLEVTEGIEGALDALRPGLGDVRLDSTIYRPATFIESAVGNLGIALLIALVLVALALIVFLRDWRATLVSLASIVLSYLAAGLALYLVGATVNAMVVAGLALALGLVVDEAVVAVEAIARRLREPVAGDGERTRASIIVEEAVSARGAVVYATLIIILSVVPLFFLSGAGGAFMPPLVVAYLVAAVAGIVVGLTVGVALISVLQPSGRPAHGLGRILPPAGLRRRLAAVGPRSASGRDRVRGRRLRRRRGHRREHVPAGRRCRDPDVQGARRAPAVGRRARHVRPGDEPTARRGQPRYAGPSGSSERLRSQWARHPVGPGRQHQPSRAVGQHRSRR